MRGVHHLLRKSSRRIGDERYVITEFHRETAGGLDAGIGHETDKDDLLDTVLLELLVEIGVGKAALSPMFLDDHSLRAANVGIAVFFSDLPAAALWSRLVAGAQGGWLTAKMHRPTRSAHAGHSQSAESPLPS
jgi:hypothetical protein